MAHAQALIMYGDGFQALFYGWKNITVNRKGVQVRPVLVVPSEELKMHYGLNDDFLNIKLDDGKMARWMEYPEDYIEWLNRSLQNAVVFVACGFDGSPTAHMSRNDELYNSVVLKDQRISWLTMYVDKLQIDLRNLTVQAHDFMRLQKELQDILTAKTESQTTNQTEGQ